MPRWQILKRKPGSMRRRMIRGVEYDGSKWTLHKSYATEDDARKALTLLEHRYTSHTGMKSMSFKLVEKD